MLSRKNTRRCLYIFWLVSGLLIAFQLEEIYWYQAWVYWIAVAQDFFGLPPTTNVWLPPEIQDIKTIDDVTNNYLHATHGFKAQSVITFFTLWCFSILVWFSARRIVIDIIITFKIVRNSAIRNFEKFVEQTEEQARKNRYQLWDLKSDAAKLSTQLAATAKKIDEITRAVRHLETAVVSQFKSFKEVAEPTAPTASSSTKQNTPQQQTFLIEIDNEEADRC